MKNFFSLKISICLIFFYFSANSLFAQNNNYGIKNFCEQVSVEDLLIKKIKISNIEVKIKNQRKWNKNVLRTIIRNQSSDAYNFGFERVDIIEPERKRKFNSEIILNYSNNKSCTLKSRIRLHGDFLDHIEFDDGYPVTSMHVRLQEGNINNIVKFKLFLPRSRNYMSEIFISNFFKHLGFISPRTSLIKVKINGKFYNYIFQEHIAKELLENNNFVEGPLLEGDESFVLKLGNDAKRLARITNSSWANKGKDELKQSIAAISYLNNIALKSNFYKLKNPELDLIEDIIYDPDILLNHHHKMKRNFLAYESFMYALDATHGLAFQDRRFYYDPIYASFAPIYYDGGSRLFSPDGYFKPQFYDFKKDSTNPLNTKYSKNFNKKLRSTKMGAVFALDLFKKVKVLQLKEELNESGFNINLKDLNIALKLIKERLENIKISKEYEIKPIDFDQPYYSFFKYNKKTELIFYDEKNKLFYQCPANSINKNKCVSQLFTNQSKKIPIYLEQERLDTQNDEEQNVFVGKSINNYFSNNFVEEKNITSWERFNLENINIVYFGNINFKIDRKNKIIFLKGNEAFNRVVFFDGVLDGWKIEFDGGGESNFEFSRKSEGLTGCITFLDAEVLDIELNIKNTKCEDSVNFIRSKGTIKNLKINNSSSDAFDADFSELYLKNIEIDKAKNDCLDFSFGNYKIENANINNCGDKGISFGEGTKGKINKVNIINTSIGIASKDSSFIIINKILNKQSNVCLAAYRKKQEFYGSIIFYDEINCDAQTMFYSDSGSIIKKEKFNEL